MPPRKSQHYLAKKGKVGRAPFLPDMKEWRKACAIYQFDKQIIQHFDICTETFYGFLDRQRCLAEEGKKAEYLEAYKKERNNTRELITEAFFKNIREGDISSVIFGMKTHAGYLEAKDIKHIELKKVEVAFKTKQFLTDLASKFQLSYEQLDDFAKKYFKESKLEEI